MNETNSYSQAVRHPLACVALVLPLLVVYEACMLWLLSRGEAPPRTGMDLWLNWSFDRLGLPWVWLPSMAVAACVAAWAAAAWQSPAPRERLGLVLGMGVESVVAALLLFGLFYFQHPFLKACGLEVPSPASPPALVQSVSYFGAAVYEETAFRLLLFGGMVVLLRGAFGPGLAISLAVLASAAIFAAAHHLGDQGESWNQGVFLFRLVAGVYFALLFLARGFGIAVGAHAAYDILVGLAGQ